MARLPLVGLGNQLRKAGLKVKKVKGWETRGRAHPFTPRRTGFHHTASGRKSGNAPCLGLVTRGTSKVPGPLCNILMGRDGTVYLIAAGYSNHFGLGGPTRGIPKDSGNRYVVGFEVENDGIGEPWSRELIEACDTAFAVTLRFVKRPRARHHLGHKEWAPDRKIDPRGIDMNRDRKRVAMWLRTLKRRRVRKRRRG
jgi:hypothetical protein